jgi:hexosaminidase
VLVVIAIACAPRPAMPPRPERLVPVIPAPHVANPTRGDWLPADTIDVWVADTTNAELEALGRLAVDIVAEHLGGPMALVTGRQVRERPITLRLVEAEGDANPEAYTLAVAPEGVSLTASTGAGLFYALQSLRQLLEDATHGTGSGSRAPRATSRVAGLTVVDRPRFPYRGLHLDVGRHFQPVAFVKRYIDLMARYKLNRFHWHLTEDQGWRIEIVKYPRLATVASCRSETMVERNFNPYVGDSIPHCGFYTQDEIRDVVSYASARYVTIVPEIELPGHAKAALAAYPDLACTDGPFEVRTTWGVDQEIFCPKEETFTFLEDVLAEVMALFPGRYIHIGGDEAPKNRWRTSPVAQEVIRREALKDENELQSWFIKRIERFLLANGRRLIGWDEILEGGLAPEATVMSWRGTSGGIEAARQGHDVIMTPNSHLYFDHYQGDARFEPLAIGGFSPLERVYAYEPVPDELTTGEARHILGAQANIWTEYLKTPQAVEYMAWPRALALAELTWSTREARDWDSFVARLPGALRTLGALGVNYRVPAVQGLDGDRLTLDPAIAVTLGSLLPDAEIRYTVDGSDPSRSSTRYTGPVRLPVSAEGVRVTARVYTRDGRASPPRAATFKRTTYRVADPPVAVQPGLRAAYWDAEIRSVRAIDTLRPARTSTIATVGLGDERAERYALRLSGYLDVPDDALYEFALSSDDGSSLQVGDMLVVNNDGLHGDEERTGMIALRRGLHPVTVRYFQGGGGASLSLRYRRGDDDWRVVPDDWLRHANPTR